MNIQAEKVTINGVDYIRADQVQEAKPNGNRYVVVVDRGWIFAGDMSIVEVFGEKHIRLDRALHVFKWESVGFAGMIKNTEKADLRPIDPVEIPFDAKIYHVQVSDSWGL
jgi:hypothetical protein